MDNLKPQNISPKDDNGIEHGEWIWYHLNGRLMYRRNYIHGIAHGLSEHYDNGTLRYQGYYNMGRNVGYFYNIDEPNEYYLWII